jgi:hypothetical protein
MRASPTFVYFSNGRRLHLYVIVLWPLSCHMIYTIIDQSEHLIVESVLGSRFRVVSTWTARIMIVNV